MPRSAKYRYTCPLCQTVVHTPSTTTACTAPECPFDPRTLGKRCLQMEFDRGPTGAIDMGFDQVRVDQVYPPEVR